jgi:hypothetical protein
MPRFWPGQGVPADEAVFTGDTVWAVQACSPRSTSACWQANVRRPPRAPSAAAPAGTTPDNRGPGKRTLPGPQLGDLRGGYRPP